MFLSLFISGPFARGEELTNACGPWIKTLIEARGAHRAQAQTQALAKLETLKAYWDTQQSYAQCGVMRLESVRALVGRADRDAWSEAQATCEGTHDAFVRDATSGRMTDYEVDLARFCGFARIPEEAEFLAARNLCQKQVADVEARVGRARRWSLAQVTQNYPEVAARCSTGPAADSTDCADCGRVQRPVSLLMSGMSGLTNGVASELAKKPAKETGGPKGSESTSRFSRPVPGKGADVAGRAKPIAQKKTAAAPTDADLARKAAQDERIARAVEEMRVKVQQELSSAHVEIESAVAELEELEEKARLERFAAATRLPLSVIKNNLPHRLLHHGGTRKSSCAKPSRLSKSGGRGASLRRIWAAR